MKKYKPSNGSEGEMFMDSFCMQCFHCDPDPDGEKQCEVLLNTMIHDLNDPEYPGEWIYKDGYPVCTKHKKWDWGNDGYPDKPMKPSPPPVPDNQLMLFSEFDEMINTKVKEVV